MLQVDLVGGYYDAGDNVKFGLPMAFTVTMLSWSVVEYGGDIAVAGELKHALEAIKWGTDYFIKAHTHPNVLWAQVRIATHPVTTTSISMEANHERVSRLLVGLGRGRRHRPQLLAKARGHDDVETSA